MRLLLAEPRGFCAGVVRAIETVEKALQQFGPPIFVKHGIVHNQHVLNRLKNLGAVFVENLAEVPKGAYLIYSAHGVAPSVRAEAKQRGLIEIDATCGLVTKVHSAVKRFAAAGYQIILIGHAHHVEIIGTRGEAPDVTHVVEDLHDIDRLSFPTHQKLAFLTQTTLSLFDVQAMTEALYKKYPHIETLPSSSVCYATTNRQLALEQLAEQAQLILVVGDPTSSNSNRLVEVARQYGSTAYLIHESADIDPAWLHQIEVLGLTAGASTPENIVHDCIARLKALGVSQVESVIYTYEHVVFGLPRQLV